jgi:hypothetical protein
MHDYLYLGWFSLCFFFWPSLFGMHVGINNKLQSEWPSLNKHILTFLLGASAFADDVCICVMSVEQLLVTRARY